MLTTCGKCGHALGTTRDVPFRANLECDFCKQSARITELEAENARLLAEVERLRKAGEQLLLLIEHETDLPQGAANGVTDNTGALDEGVCLASDIIEEMRAALRGESEAT